MDIKDDDEAATVHDSEHCLTHIVEDSEPILRGLDFRRQDAIGIDSKRAEHLAPWPERRRTLTLSTTSPGDSGAAGEGHARELSSEPGLTDARLASAENEPTGSASGGVEPGPQRV
jgi:hypothetical protein